VTAVTEAAWRLLPEPTVVEPTVVEPLAPGDATAVRQVFDGLSPRSRALRFLTAKPRLTSTDLRALTDVDGHDRVALVARDDDGRPVGIARFVRDDTDPHRAEAAVAVVDAWHRRGVGTQLARALVDRAHEVGIRRFSVSISHDNEAAARLLHAVAADVRRVSWDGGTMDFEVSFGAAGRRSRGVLKGAAG
jgi:RimJ/RimL family protein N-acetyltransferase